ncbi:MAG: hypothetical protein K2K82_01745 [Muribaculaceae bacterium]|nr:hypothetical protein [Muribaculaceae bacterium]
MFQDITNLIIPICVCVVLPISIVWIVMRTAQLRDRQRTDIILKAIETNNSIDANQLTEALSKPHKAPRTPHQQLNLRLTIGSIFTLFGVMLTGLTVCAIIEEPVLGCIMSIFCMAFLSIGIGFLISYYSMRKQINAEK